MTIDPVHIEETNEQLGNSIWMDNYETPEESAFVDWYSIHDMGDGTYVLYHEDSYGNRVYESTVFGPVVHRWKRHFRELEYNDS